MDVAARSTRAAAGSAIDAALARIGAAFGEAAAINGFKLRVERCLILGPRHPAMRARFGARAALLTGCGLDAAIATVEGWWREERKAFPLAAMFGYGNRLSLDVLRDLRLILRLLRYRRMHVEFGALVALLCDDDALLEAAE